jgi:hypothetical protein
MNLLHSANTLGTARSHEDPRKIAHRTRDLFAEVLKRTISTPTVDGRPVFVRLQHHAPDKPAQISASPAEAMENYERFDGSQRKAVGARALQVDMPIPARRGLATSASRLRVELFAPSGDRDQYGYDLTAYKPFAGHDEAFDPTKRLPKLHFREDDVRHQLLIRGDINNPGTHNIRTAMQSPSDEALDIKTYAYLGAASTLETAHIHRALPELTRQEQQLFDLGAHTLAYCQIRQDLSIMSAFVDQDPARPMGVY